MQSMLLKKTPWSPSESYPLFFARFFALVSLCAVPLSTAGVNMGSGIVLVLALLSPEAWVAARRIAVSRASIVALILFAVLALSLFYTTAERSEAVNFLMKYRKLLLLPVLFLVFHGSDRTIWGRAAIWTLFASLVLTMVLTYTNFFGWTAVGPMHGNDAISRQWVFKDHISGGLMMAFLVCISVALAKEARTCATRWALYGTALLALVNVLLVLKGRTGQVVAMGYMAIYVLMHLRRFKHQDKRTRWITSTVFVAGCVCLVAFAFMAKNSRLAETGQEFNQFEEYNQDTSVGVRLEFYRRSSELILMRPIAGFGVGSVRTEFAMLTKDSTGGRAAMAGNPHNEFFLMGVQIGLIGVVLFAWFLIEIWRECRKLALLERTVVYGYLFAFVLGCLANSLLLNFTEGNLFIFVMGILLFSGRRRDAAELPANAAA